MLTTSLQTLHTHNTRGGQKGSRNFPVGKKNFSGDGDRKFSEKRKKRMEPALDSGKKIEVTNKC